MTAQPEPLLQLQGICKRWGDTPLFNGLSLGIAAATTTVLIGPSGCGKSTLLRLFNGLVRPDAGSVHFNGEPLDYRDLRSVRHRMGYVVQEGGLFPHLTAADNITLLARHLGWPAERCADRLAALAQLTRLEAGVLARYPTELSGGQRQRVSLCRALMPDPPVLLLDEPLGALDPMVRYGLQTDLLGIFRELDKTVILVTHDLAEAAHFADEVVLMHAGAIAQRGDMSALLEAPASDFVRAFVRAQRGLGWQ